MGAKDKAGSRGRGGPCSGCCRGTPKPLPPRERTVTLNDRSGANKAFPLNKVSNTKYTLWTFVPKNLYEQFSAPMNLYFLLIALLQLWRTITPVSEAHGQAGRLLQSCPRSGSCDEGMLNWRG